MANDIYPRKTSGNNDVLKVPDVSDNKQASFGNTNALSISQHVVEYDDGEYTCKRCDKSETVPALDMLGGTRYEPIVRAYAFGSFAKEECDVVDVVTAPDRWKINIGGRNFALARAPDGTLYLTDPNNGTVQLVADDISELREQIEQYNKVATDNPPRYTNRYSSKSTTSNNSDDTSDDDGGKSWLRRMLG